jgi:hypothetical protein
MNMGEIIEVLFWGTECGKSHVPRNTISGLNETFIVVGAGAEENIRTIFLNPLKQILLRHLRFEKRRNPVGLWNTLLVPVEVGKVEVIGLLILCLGETETNPLEAFFSQT